MPYTRSARVYEYVKLDHVPLQISKFDTKEELILGKTALMIEGNKKLHHISLLNNLRSFSTSFKYIRQDALEDFAENASQLEKLDALFDVKAKIYNLDCFGKLTNLNSIILRDLIRFHDADLGFLEKLPKLQEVGLEWSGYITCASVSNLKNLKTLKIVGCAKIKEGSLEPLANTGIETLVLEDSQVYLNETYNFIGTANLNTLLALKDVKTLKHLHLQDCYNLNGNEMRSLQKELPNVEITFA